MTAQLIVTALGGAAAGAALTFLGSLLTGWLGRRHDHRCWLLDKRLEAYAAFMSAENAWELAWARRAEPAELTDAYRELEDRWTVLSIVAPQDTSTHAKAVIQVATDSFGILSATGRQPKPAAVTAANREMDRITSAARALRALQERDIQRQR